MFEIVDPTLPSRHEIEIFAERLRVPVDAILALLDPDQANGTRTMSSEDVLSINEALSKALEPSLGPDGTPDEPLAQSTRKTYLGLIKRFERHLADNNTDLFGHGVKIPPEVAVSFVSAPVGGNRAAEATRALRFALLRRVSRTLLVHGAISGDLTAGILRPKARLSDRRGLYPREVRTLIELARHTRYGIRDSALVRTMVYTGPRLQEVLDVTLGDIHWCWGPSEVPVIVFHGKGGFDRTIPIPEKLHPHLEEYISVCHRIDPHALPLKDPDMRATPLFFRWKDGHKWPLSKRAVQDNLSRVFVKVRQIHRIDEKHPLCPHILRHTFAVTLLRNGCSVIDIKALLGHKHVSTTEIYLRLQEEDLRRVLERNPLSNEGWARLGRGAVDLDG